MNAVSFGQTFLRITKLGTLSAALCFGLAAQAQQTTPEQAYQEAIKHCETIADEEQRLNCRRDAAAALQQAKSNPERYQQIDEQILLKNRISRCDSLPAEQRELCIKSLEENPDTQIMGTVEGGGILRKTTITERGEPYTVPASEAPQNVQEQKPADLPTSNTEEAIKAREHYGVHPVR